MWEFICNNWLWLLGGYALLIVLVLIFLWAAKHKKEKLGLD